MKEAIKVLLEQEIRCLVKENGIEGTEDVLKKEYKANIELQSEMLICLYRMYWSR